MVKAMLRILRYILVLVVLAVIAFGVWLFFETRPTKTYEAPVTPVQVEKAQYRRLSDSISVTGYIEADAMVPVVPFVQGTITEYYALEGKTVGKGDLLAVIDPEPYLLQMKQAEAAYLVYEASYERVKSLYEAGAASRQAFDEVQAQRDAGKAQYDLASLQLGYAYVTSPVSGTILMAPSSVGSIGTSSSPLAVIADLSKLVVNITLPEKYYSDVISNKGNLKVSISRSTGGEEESVDAEVVSISPFIDAATKTFSMKVRLLGDASSFRPGMFIKAKVIYREEDVLSLPQMARKLDGSVYYVEKDGEGHRARFIQLEKGMEDDSFFQIPSSYEGYDFIVRGQNSILSGQSVRVTEGF